MKVDRRSVLVGSLAGLTAGGGAGYVSGTLAEMSRNPPATGNNADPDLKPCYAQHGEDLVVRSILGMLDVPVPSFLDIGAHHPSANSNTYLLYKAGGRGVLVEPNPKYAELLRERRKGDTVLEIGIGITDQSEADYYLIAGDGQRNTFSKEQADELVKLKGRGVLVGVIKRPLVKVNAVLAKHFPARAPDFVSIDVEGLDHAILETFDFEKYRPKVFCVETATLTGEVHKDILALMESKEYAVRGGSFVNTIFVDRRALQARPGDGGHDHEH